MERREATVKEAMARQPPSRRARTAVKTGGGGRYWVCFVRNRFFTRPDRLCSIVGEAPGQTRHRDCGWHRFDSTD